MTSLSPPTALVPERGLRIDRLVVTAVTSSGRHATVVQARDQDDSFVALKLATTPVGSQLVEHEEQVLRAIPAETEHTARLVAAGRVGGSPYCASAWLYGVDARVAAGQVRGESGRAGILELCRGIARSYADVHARGIVHGQVHPRHVLVDGDCVRLIDFSVAESKAAAPPAGRLEARFNSLSAPEHAETLLRGDEIVLTAAAEQYSIAALLYLLATARMHARLRLDRSVLARDVVAAPVLPFADQGVDRWPELEAVLGRALRKDPGRRYASVSAFAEALEEVPRERSAAGRVAPSPALRRVLETFRRDAASRDAISSLKAPTCSINFGAAGVAFALTRLGNVTEDPTAFDEAERWLAWAERNSANADAFDDGDELTPESVGVVSPFHSASGVATARAFLSAATGDHARQQAALDDYCALTAAPCSNVDLTLGRSAVLLVAALLYASADPAWPATQRLARYGDDVCAGIWADAAGAAVPYYYGIAHGWAGLAYATLMWSRARAVDAPAEARRVLDMLATAAEPHARGARWPLTPPSGTANDEFWPGWCHGNAGYVFLWNLAEQAYPGAGFGAARRVARRRCSSRRPA